MSCSRLKRAFVRIDTWLPLLLCLIFTGSSYGEDSTGWQVYRSTGISFQYPSPYIVTEFIDTRSQLRPRVIRLVVDRCALWNDFRIELYEEKSIDKIFSSGSLESSPTLKEYLKNVNLVSDEIHVGGRQGVRMKWKPDLAGTTILLEQVQIQYDEFPNGCTFNLPLHEYFEKLISTIKFGENE